MRGSPRTLVSTVHDSTMQCRTPRPPNAPYRAALAPTSGRVVPEPSLSPGVLRLVHGPVATMAHVELLLLMRTAAPAMRSAAELATAAHVSDSATAQRCLDELTRAGLLTRVGDPAGFRYAPTDAALDSAVDALAAMYNEKPVTLVRALYSRRAV